MMKGPEKTLGIGQYVHYVDCGSVKNVTISQAVLFNMCSLLYVKFVIVVVTATI